MWILLLSLILQDDSKADITTSQKRISELRDQLQGMPDHDTALYAAKCVDLRTELARCDSLWVAYAVRKYRNVDYDVFRGGEKFGTLKLHSEFDQLSVVFKDSLAFEDRGKAHEAVITVRCGGTTQLPLESAATTMDGREKSLVVRDGRTVIDGETVDVAPGTMAGYAFLRRMALVQPKERMTLTFDNFGFDGLRLEKGGVLKYAGKEKIRRGDAEVETDKWTTAVPGREKPVAFYFEDGLLLRLDSGTQLFEKK
jgi:hypothetical protein